MKKILFLSLICVFGFIVSTSVSSCKTKEGCGLEEKYAPAVDRDGTLSRKKGKSNLFSKKQRKNMKKRGQD